MASRFLAGHNHFDKVLACEKYIERNRHNRDLWLDLSELIARDRRCEHSSDDVPATLEEWAKDPAISNRGLYAPQMQVAY